MNSEYMRLIPSNLSTLIDKTTTVIPTVIFQVDQIVHVKRRCWAGINKPGGTARIVAINKAIDETSGEVQERPISYDVKYILTSAREKGVPSAFIEASEDLQKERTERRRRDTKG